MQTKLFKQFLAVGAFLCALINSQAGLAVLDAAINPANNHTYYLLSNSTWTAAESQAVLLGGHLVTVNDQAENDWVWNRWGTNRSLWIGLHDPVFNDGTGAQHGSNFVWASGEVTAFKNWNSGEPNNGNSGE